MKHIFYKGSKHVQGTEALILHHLPAALHEKSLQQSEAERNGMQTRLKGMNTFEAERKFNFSVMLCVVIHT